MSHAWAHSDCDVLIVDDDPAFGRVVSAILEAEGYRVAMAKNGVAAVDRIVLLHPKVVLLDMHMPILDGWGVVGTLRQRQVECQIVLVTAAPGAQRWVRELGAVGYLSKPFELADLLTTVERLSQVQTVS